MSSPVEIAQTIKFIQAAFPNYHPEENAAEVFLILLGDIPADALLAATMQTCAESGRQFAPSAGELRGAVVKMRMQAEGVPDISTAWTAVVRSFQVRSFSELDPETVRILRHPIVKETYQDLGGLIALQSTENPSLERAHFFKLYEQIYSREAEEKGGLPQVRAYLESHAPAEIKQLAERMQQ